MIIYDIIQRNESTDLREKKSKNGGVENIQVFANAFKGYKILKSKYQGLEIWKLKIYKNRVV